jgi:hypothetical protein
MRCRERKGRHMVELNAGLRVAGVSDGWDPSVRGAPGQSRSRQVRSLDSTKCAGVFLPLLHEPRPASTVDVPAKPGCKFRPCSGGWPFWFGGHLSHGYGDDRRVALLAFDPPPFSTRGEDACEIGLCQPGEPKTRHLDSARGFARVLS